MVGRPQVVKNPIGILGLRHDYLCNHLEESLLRIGMPFVNYAPTGTKSSMKTLSSLVFGLVLVGGLTTTASAQLAPQNFEAQRSSFAERMPASTIAYVEIPDIANLRLGIEKSSLGKFYSDPELQTFLGDSISILDQSWLELRGMAAGMGIPEELTYWDALRSLELGVAMEVKPGLENPFSEPPNLYFGARIGLSEGLGMPVFGLLTMALEGQGFEVIGTEAGQALIMSQSDFMNPEQEMFSVEVSQEGDDIILEFIMGAKPSGSLAATAGYQGAHKDMFIDGAVVFGYVQIQDLMQTVLKAAAVEAPEIHATLSMIYDRALKPLQNISFSSGWTDEGSFTKSRIELSENPGELWEAGAADLSLMEYVPADSSAFYVNSVSAKAWGGFLLDCIDAGGALELQEGFPASEMLKGQNSEVYGWLFGEKRPELEAAMAAIGSQSFGYSVSQGMASESVNFLQLSDGAGFSAMLEQLMPRLRETLTQLGAPVGLDMKYVRRRVKQEDGTMTNVAGPAYYMINLDGLADIPPQAAVILGSLQPTMGVTEDGWLVFSMSKQRVRHLLLKGLEKPEANIKSNPEASAFVNSLDSSAMAVSWSDPRPLVGTLAGMAVGFAPMAFNMVPENVGLPISADDIPSADLFTRYLRTNESVSRATGNLRLCSSIGSFGFADIFTVLGSATAVGPPIAQYFLMANMGGESSVQQLHADSAPAPEAEYDEEF